MNTKLSLFLVTMILIGLTVSSPEAATMAPSGGSGSFLAETSQISPPRMFVGDLLVVDKDAGTANRGALFHVQRNGVRTLFHDFGVGDHPGLEPIDVVVASTGEAYVLDPGVMIIFRINLSTGRREIYVDLTAPQDEPFVSPEDMAIDANNILWVIDSDAGKNETGGLFRISGVNFAQLMIGLPDLGENATGIDILQPNNVVFITNKGFRDNPGSLVIFDIFVFDENQTINFSDFNCDVPVREPGHLVIDPITLNLYFIDDADERTHLVQIPDINRTGCNSFFTIAQPPLQPPVSAWVAIDPIDLPIGRSSTSNIFITNPDGGRNGNGELIQLVADTKGKLTRDFVLSDFGDSVTGDLGVNPMGIALVRQSSVPAPPAGTVRVDNFDRPNGPIGPFWFGRTRNPSGYRIVNEQLDVGAGGPIVFEFEHGPAAEVSFKFINVDENGQNQGLILKALRTSDPQNDAFIAADYVAAEGRVYIHVLRARSDFVTYPKSIEVTYNDGDRMKMVVRQRGLGVVEIYRNDELKGTVTLDITDSQFFNFRGGQAGFGFLGADDAIIDDFTVKALEH